MNWVQKQYNQIVRNMKTIDEPIYKVRNSKNEKISNEQRLVKSLS